MERPPGALERSGKNADARRFHTRRLGHPSQLAKLIPRGDYVEIAGAGHNIWLSQADALYAELHAAVKKLKTAL